jgi:hypothetical protein
MYLGTNDPSYSPSWKSEALGKTIDDQNIIFIHILDVLCCTDGRAVAIGSVVISTVELIHDQSRAVTADILDLRKLGVLDYLSSRVTGVRGQDH